MEATPRHDSEPGAVKQKRTSFHYILYTTYYTLHTTYTAAGGFLFQAGESQFSLVVP